MLGKDPAARPNLAEIIKVLDEVENGEPATPAPTFLASVSRRKRAVRALAYGGLALLAVGAVLGFGGA